MGDLRSMIDGWSTIPGSRLQLRREGDVIDVEVPGGRHQRVRMVQEGAFWTLRTNVASRRLVAELEPVRMAELIWRRNTSTDLVDFHVDGGLLVGRVRLVGAEMQAEEVAYALSQLAIEADRFEFTLTGQDEY